MISAWIEKQKSGIYLVRLRSKDGKNLKSINCGWDKVLAKQIVLREKQASIYRNLKVTNPDKSLKDLIQDYVEDYARSKSAYTAKLFAYMAPAFIGSARKLGEITTDHINRYRDEQLKQFSPFTVRSRLRSVSAFLGWAVKRGFLDSSPFKGVEVPNPQPIPKFMSDEDFNALDAKAKGDIKLAFRIAVTTGLRQANVIGLNYEDIQDGMFVVQKTKGKRPVSVPVHPLVRELLDKNGKGRIFPRMTRHTLRHAWLDLKKDAKVEKVTWHSARHTFTKKALQSGLTTFEVMKFTGHAAPQSMIPYAHFEMKKMKDRYAKIKF